jgi:hypothetical protein
MTRKPGSYSGNIQIIQDCLTPHTILQIWIDFFKYSKNFHLQENFNKNS